MAHKKSLLISGVALFVATLGTLPVEATRGGHQNHKKIGICHATGSRTNPYVFIRVSKNAGQAHEQHQNGRDVVGVNSKEDCPQVAVAAVASVDDKDEDKEKQGRTKEEDKKPEVKKAAAATPSPSRLPDAGPASALGTAAGLSALGYTATAYARNRKRL